MAVTTAAITTTKGTLTASDFSLTSSVTYDSTPQSAGVTPVPTGVGTVTVYYDGLAALPSDAGVYAVTVDVTLGTKYFAVNGLSLGNFTINKAPIVVTPDSGQKKYVGQPDPVLTYTVDIALFPGDAFTGELSRDPGDTVGSYEVRQNTLDAGSNYDLTFTPGVFFNVTVQSVDRYITSTASLGAVITPLGTVTVSEGNSITFFFTAASVTVDGKALSQADVDKGYYTFGNVLSNHTIAASGTGTGAAITVGVDVSGGNGKIEYSVNGSPFAPYTGSIPMQAGSSLTLRAVADGGYVFKEWRLGTTVYSDSVVSFSNVTTSMGLDLIFVEAGDDGGFPWLIVVIVLVIIIIVIIIAAVLLKRKPAA
jgi:hypothetical protein